mgnify:CR=1 FL=1
MDRNTVGLADMQRSALHQKIVLLIIHFKHTDLIILVVECHEMLVIGEYAHCLREFTADLAVAV